MKKIIVLVAILCFAALFMFGCANKQNYAYPTGYAAAGGQPQGAHQGYVGGGCAVSGTDVGNAPNNVFSDDLAA